MPRSLTVLINPCAIHSEYSSRREIPVRPIVCVRLQRIGWARAREMALYSHANAGGEANQIRCAQGRLHPAEKELDGKVCTLSCRGSCKDEGAIIQVNYAISALGASGTET